MEKCIFFIFASLFLSSADAETVGAGSTRTIYRAPAVLPQDNSVIAPDLAQIKRSLANSSSPNHNKDNNFAYINKCVPNASCTTYLVNIKTGEILDKFTTLNGIGSMGCGAGQTEPGLFQMDDKAQPPGKHHDNWGNQSLYLMRPLDPTITKCPHDKEKVVHGRKDVRPDDPETIAKNTRGCMGMPPEKFEEIKKYAEQGIVIYNTESKN
jgi:hypothetical protein